MTVQEAIRKMKFRIDTACKIAGRGKDGKAYEDMEIAIESMEKQIPQSPTLEGDGYCPEGHLVYDTWFCPNCDKSYEVDYDDYDYCPNCGQKIDKSVFDWEEGGTSEV